MNGGEVWMMESYVEVWMVERCGCWGVDPSDGGERGMVLKG